LCRRRARSGRHCHLRLLRFGSGCQRRDHRGSHRNRDGCTGNLKFAEHYRPPFLDAHDTLVVVACLTARVCRHRVAIDRPLSPAFVAASLWRVHLNSARAKTPRNFGRLTASQRISTWHRRGLNRHTGSGQVETRQYPLLVIRDRVSRESGYIRCAAESGTRGQVFGIHYASINPNLVAC